MGIVGGGAVGVIGLASPRESLRNKGHALYSDVAANRQARLCNDRGGAVRAYRVDVPTEFVWNDQVTAKRTAGRWRHSQPSLEGRTCSTCPAQSIVTMPPLPLEVPLASNR